MLTVQKKKKTLQRSGLRPGPRWELTALRMSLAGGDGLADPKNPTSRCQPFGAFGPHLTSPCLASPIPHSKISSDSAGNEYT